MCFHYRHVSSVEQLLSPLPSPFYSQFSCPIHRHSPFFTQRVNESSCSVLIHSHLWLVISCSACLVILLLSHFFPLQWLMTFICTTLHQATSVIQLYDVHCNPLDFYYHCWPEVQVGSDVLAASCASLTWLLVTFLLFLLFIFVSIRFQAFILCFLLVASWC